MLNHPRKASPLPEKITLRVRISQQRLDVIENGHIRESYPVSTSQFGIGTEPDSFKTPLGRFRIAEKFGQGAASGTVFKGRQPTGAIAPQGGDDDLILSRIFWLEGLDPENLNTHDRYIYIHGTNQEHLIGTPASHGCVRMTNADILDLYRDVPEGTVLEIVE